MCGITGFNFVTLDNRFLELTRHRGPDFSSKVEINGFTLGHNRLSIIDLSPKANQPFLTTDGNYAIVYNGEVYNFQEIRKTLENKYQFRSNGDAEVILFNYIEKGEKCLNDFNGMFAFAIYDKPRQRLFAARDRLGIKPFNYYWKDGKFIFASEIKTILHLLKQKPEINHAAISQFLRYLYVPAPYTVYNDITKLLPAHYLILENDKLTINRYWDINSIKENTTICENEILDQLDHLLNDSIKNQMISDVELGSFLSGGIDSSTILYYMARNSAKPVNTFTLTFPGEKHYDESSDARIMANYFGTNHREIIIKPTITELLPKMVHYFDEPFGNPTALLIHELTKETKKYATVALAGDGGDEVFCGYPRYKAAMIAQQLKYVSPFFWKFVSVFTDCIPESTSGYHSLRRGKSFIRSLGLPSDLMYEDWVGYYTNREMNNLLVNPCSYDSVVKNIFNSLSDRTNLSKATITDLQTFLPYNVLAYGDAMSMANAFEVRVPLIDHRIVELLVSLPAKYKIRGNTTKYILRKLLKGKVPDEIINKPKQGLNPPLGSWLKSDLKP